MDYLNQIVDYIKDLKEIIPKNVSLPVNVKIPGSSQDLPTKLYGADFGIEDYLFFGLIVVLFLTVFVLKYDSYRFFRVASKEMRHDIYRDMKHLLVS